MGWVGPRPLLPEQLLAIPDEYMARFDVRPGITGLAQVRGRRSLGWLEQLQADTEYARQANVLLDLKIMAQTVKVILTREGLIVARRQTGVRMCGGRIRPAGLLDAGKETV